jgi:hypothetical protein
MARSIKTHLKYGFYLVVAAGCIACASRPAPAASQISFDEVKGKEWRLRGVHLDSRLLVLDRHKLSNEGFADAFTLIFEDRQVHGRGAPNTFRAPYEQGQNQSISIGNAAATLMAPLKEPEDFKERDYFTYLGNIYRWNLVQDDLELYTKTGDDKDATLIFIAK